MQKTALPDSNCFMRYLGGTVKLYSSIISGTSLDSSTNLMKIHLLRNYKSWVNEPVGNFVIRANIRFKISYLLLLSLL